jgi:hypothetical protein
MWRRATVAVLVLLLCSCTVGAPRAPSTASPSPPRPSAVTRSSEPAAQRTARAQCAVSTRATSRDAADAAALMAGRIRLPPHRETTSPADPTWREDPLGDTNWVFNLHTLRWADVLRREGTRTGDRRMTDRHRALLADWVADNPRRGPATPAAWNDMSTGLRTIVLACAVGTYGPQRWLTDALDAHGAVLADPAFGLPAGNHALHVRIGLLVAGCVRDREAWKRTAEDRIAALLRRSVDAEGVTDEGSIGYQGSNFRWYGQARARLVACGRSPGAVFDRVERMPDLLAHATAPDGRYEQIGDMDDLRAIVIPSSPGALYAASRGRRGTRPVDTYRAFARGYVFGRSGWGTDRPFGDELFYALRFGPPTAHHHGHEDAGALTLYAGGRRLLFDAGRYRYDDAPMRGYLESRRAHNTVDVTGAPYDREATSVLLASRHTADHDLTSVRVFALGGTVWTRTVLYSRTGGYLVVDDRVDTTARREIVQRWNLRDDRDPVVRGTSVAGGGVTLTWVGAVPRLSFTVGQESPLLGWRSRRYGEVFAAPVAEARLAGTAARFTTVLAPGPVTVTGAVVRPDSAELTVTANGVTERAYLTRTDARVRPG